MRRCMQVRIRRRRMDDRPPWGARLSSDSCVRWPTRDCRSRRLSRRCRMITLSASCGCGTVYGVGISKCGKTWQSWCHGKVLCEYRTDRGLEHEKGRVRLNRRRIAEHCLLLSTLLTFSLSAQVSLAQAATQKSPSSAAAQLDA